jgi:nitrite reductase/ring-hydroxylating ferredoxin subunit
VSETWIDAGPADNVLLEDVAPFEHDGKSYAIYRTADDRFYATDGHAPLLVQYLLRRYLCVVHSTLCHLSATTGSS